MIPALQKMNLLYAITNEYTNLIFVLMNKKLPINGIHNFPNSAKIIFHEFLPALRFFSFSNARSKPAAHMGCTVP